MKVRDILKRLEQDGWKLKSVEGSYRQLIHPTKPGKVTVSGHPSIERPVRHAIIYFETCGL